MLPQMGVSPPFLLEGKLGMWRGCPSVHDPSVFCPEIQEGHLPPLVPTLEGWSQRSEFAPAVQTWGGQGMGSLSPAWGWVAPT